MSKRSFSILAFLIIFACVISAVSQTKAQTKSGDADSNNDGIGDLKGITSKMSYLHDLGVDAIWISPCFPSPQVDFGYDVSDYENIDPMYGTLADFDSMVAEGKKQGVRIILDFVVNHTSDQHPWFVDSKSSKI